MRRVIACSLLAIAAMLSALPPARVPAQSVEAGQDGPFRLEWSKNGRKVDGYVYNLTSRHAAHMQLLVEGVDPSGTVVNTKKTWVLDVPPNNRGFFEVSVPDATSYRVSILSYKWIQEIASMSDLEKVQ